LTAPLQPGGSLLAGRGDGPLTGTAGSPLAPLPQLSNEGANRDKAGQYVRQARQALTAGQFYEAIGNYNLAMVMTDLAPEDELGYLEALVGVGNFEQADAALERLVARTKSLPDLSFTNINAQSRTVMVRFLQGRLASAPRQDLKFWSAVLTLNTKTRDSLLRQLQLDLSMSTTTQPTGAGMFSPKLRDAVLDYISRTLAK
jgi:hypothetical protein